MQRVIFFSFLIFFFSACLEHDPNLNAKGEDVIEAKEMYIEVQNLVYQDTVYVPIYSDIYSETKEFRINLTATLSIRNTSLTDSLFIEDIDYYDTNGDLVRHYIDKDKTLLLKPMQSIEYVIEKNDTKGGTGANFLVNWGAQTRQLKPVFQGVMISTGGQQGISFVTEGVSLRN